MSVLLKGALIEYMPTYLKPVPNVIVFQYNPETLTHAWSQPEAAPPSENTTNWPMAVMGMPGESFSFKIAVDANDEIADGSANLSAGPSLPTPLATTSTTGIAPVSSVYRRLAALEMLLYPTGPAGSGLLGAVSAAAAPTLSDGSSNPTTSNPTTSNPTTSVPASTLPVVLFVWGPRRVVPVRVTDLTITEQLYNGTLSPTHAEAELSLRVLTPAELAAAGSDYDVLGNLATVAYNYTLGLRQALAAAQPTNAPESIIGINPP
jgi:hypothetical protein